MLARQAQVNAAAAHAGLHIDFSRIARMPNTRLALRLLRSASEQGSPEQVDAVLEQLFHAHFLQGRDIGDAATLRAIARNCQLNEVTAQQALAESASAPALEDKQAPLHAGVPYFVFNGQFGLAGAQPPDVLLQAMHQAMSPTPQPVQDCA
jgi:predicted DsbA family dithiol-disulfide isomerase